MSKLYNDVVGVFAENISEAEMISRYSDVASVYEQEVDKKEYTGPYVIAREIGELYPDGRDTKEILDIAAGTGLAAEELKKIGFSIIDAIEPSEGMIELARKKCLYRNLYNIFLSAEPLPLPSDKYDAITVCGWHGKASSLAAALPEVVRVVKPGGYICFVTRMEFVRDLDEYKDTFVRQCDRLEEDGRWKQIQFTGFQGFITDVEGVTIVYQVC